MGTPNKLKSDLEQFTGTFAYHKLSFYLYMQLTELHIFVQEQKLCGYLMICHLLR